MIKEAISEIKKVVGIHNSPFYVGNRLATSAVIRDESHTVVATGTKIGNCFGPDSGSTGIYVKFPTAKQWAVAKSFKLAEA